MDVLYIVLIFASCIAISFAQISREERQAFLTGHNTRRQMVADGNLDGQPEASDLKPLKWDNELYIKAAAWAARNQNEHNSDNTVPSGRFSVGENLHLFSTTNDNHEFDPDNALENWFSENVNYRFGPIKKEDFNSEKEIGHYTQMVWANTEYVGCAKSQYREGQWNRFFVVCNYGPAGNVIGQVPYQRE